VENHLAMRQLIKMAWFKSTGRSRRRTRPRKN